MDGEMLTRLLDNISSGSVIFSEECYYSELDSG